MDPAIYAPLFVSAEYIDAHPELTEAARTMAREQVCANPEAYAHSDRARAIVRYAQLHTDLLRQLDRMEELTDEEFERERTRLFAQAREELHGICQLDPNCIDAQLLTILLADAPIDDSLSDVLELEERSRAHLEQTMPQFSLEHPHLWDPAELNAAPAERLALSCPEVIGWLHTIEVIAQECMLSARYRAAATYSRLAMRAQGYPNLAVGTLLLALARLEDEDGFFEIAQRGGESIENLPWFMLGRTLLLYKLGRRHSAARALREFARRCDGGAFFLLNPTYMNPYLPVRPAPPDPWSLAHMAVWEADGIIVDTPDFAGWAASIEGVEEASREFALRNGF